MTNYDSDPYANDYKAWLIGGIVFIIIFSAFFGTGIFLLTRQIKAMRYTPIEAIAVDYKVIYDNDSSLSPSYTAPSYFYIVEYEIDGKTYTITCDTSASKYDPPNDLGKVITIYVNPKNPRDVVFRNSTHIILTTVCLIVPVGGFVGTAFIFRKAHRIKQEKSIFKGFHCYLWE